MGIFQENQFKNALLGDLDVANERRKAETNALLDGKPSPNFPNYGSGARAKLLVNGKTIGAALDVSYSVTASVTEIRTIDQYLPWEIVPGQMSIKANLRRIVDPNRSLGSDSLYSTIQSYLHQPYVSIEIRDKLGNLQFYAKGMFTDIQANIQAGQMSVEGASFVGYYWRENVKQDYSPEDAADSVDSLIKKKFTQNSLVKKVSSIFK
ncbi:MAG: hypothetical protein EBU90_22900 [Proteobacteria bacterium]|nr:hypothetical protein [Pseudomonadota bacterium]